MRSQTQLQSTVAVEGPPVTGPPSSPLESLPLITTPDPPLALRQETDPPQGSELQRAVLQWVLLQDQPRPPTPLLVLEPREIGHRWVLLRPHRDPELREIKLLVSLAPERPAISLKEAPERPGIKLLVAMEIELQGR